MADDPGTDLHQPIAQRRHRPVFNFGGQRQGAEKVGEVVGQGVKLQPHGVFWASTGFMLRCGKSWHSVSFGLAKVNRTMPGPISSNDPLGNDAAQKPAEKGRRDEPMDDEEKVIANRPDANMPALLTRDVLGG
jgi:hypothetical protein